MGIASIAQQNLRIVNLIELQKQIQVAIMGTSSFVTTAAVLAVLEVLPQRALATSMRSSSTSTGGDLSLPKGWTGLF